MMKTHVFVTGLLILLCSEVFAQSDETWEVLKENNYEIQYPASWDLSTDAQMGTSFILLSPVDGAEDQFRENVNLIIQDLSEYDISLSEYTEISVNQIKTMITDGRLTSSDLLQQEEFEYQRVVYTGKQGIYDLKFEQFYILRNKKAYILTFTGEALNFDDYLEIGERILLSFRFSD